MSKAKSEMDNSLGVQVKECDYCEQYKLIQENEHHFNDIELEIRKLASVWLLVSLGAIAFIIRGAYLSQNGKSYLMLDPRSLIIIICCMGNLGLFVLWQLDQMVYHRLLNAVFLLGLRMEYLFPSLPPIRTLMILYTKKKGASGYQKWYYLIPMTILALTSIAFLISVFVVPAIDTALYNNILPVFTSLASSLLPILAYSQSRKKEKYSAVAENFGDKCFTDYLKMEDYRSVLHHY